MTVDKNAGPLDHDLVAAYARLTPPTVHESMGRRGAMYSRIKPIYPGMRVCGSALTVAGRPGDNLAVHHAITVARPGDVLVVSTGEYYDAGPWGEILTVAAMEAGITGLVIDGSIRDATAIRDLGFPVFAAGTNMKGTQKSLPARINVATLVAGVIVHPGDLVLGDDDGVVVVPRQEARTVLAASRDREEAEARLMHQLREGKTTVELLGLEDTLRGAGMV